MPIYEFICESCNHEFEQIVSFSAVALSPCPVCEAHSVKRRMSKPAIHFKGSGWYITDSKQNNGKNGSNGHDKSKDKSGSEKESSTEAKSETTKSDATTSDATTSDSPKSESSSAKPSVAAEA
jgi:putative FmdB family regulatory protein